ncbi:Do family serine endopeptidase [Ponticaulis sp.]|uniref:Do family serine endopeptidase n=1 Tax=Ponticaulis sp. TaxID=2020902 RepID=UPI000B67C147|nr:Do family serine endopeptidase [Ponticaulis sp.]OUX97752.1 MAG: Do family protease [Hyphomonadaceae bacterium TMED5]|tara:strand:- start:4594 stop:6033 length:1440 start_codon:yes stop_codon:yes gene_type:complete
MSLNKIVIGLSVAALASMSTAFAQTTAEQTSLQVDNHRTPDGFSELSRTLMPSVVNISTSQRVIEAGLPEFPQGSPMERFNDLFGRDGDGFRRTSSLGSGFVIDETGFIVTNNHVIEGADEIEVSFADGRTYPAELVGRDADTDIAVLKIEPRAALPALSFADSDEAEVGDWVIAIGNPFGLGGSVSAGIISARSRDINAGSYDDFIQTDAAINRGNSGGPLFNLSGEVVGVNTAIISPTGGSVGIGFSVPSNLASHIVDQLIEEGRVRRGYLGINIQAVDMALARTYGLTNAAGVIVTEVTEDSPGEEAGIEVGDLILRFDGSLITETRQLSRMVAEAELGEPMRMNIIRGERRQELTVTLREREEELPEDVEDDMPPALFAGANAYGLVLIEVTEEARRRWQIPTPVEGALIDLVDPDGPSYGQLEKGDVITEIAFQPVTSPADADELLELEGGSDPLLVKVVRHGRVSFYALELES